MGKLNTTSATLPNDGSVSGDCCKSCDGKLIIHKRGGWFLGCSNYPNGCTFKMNPNPNQMEKLEAERTERRAARAEKCRLREITERIKKAEKLRRLPPPLIFCETCFNTLSNIDAQSGRTRHTWC